MKLVLHVAYLLLLPMLSAFMPLEFFKNEKAWLG